MGRGLLLLGLALGLMTGCASRSARTTPEPRDAPSGKDSGTYLGEGLASFYGPGLHGRKTASGERFDQEALTAAHRTARFGTCMRVVNMENGRSVKVRVNDRGPFKQGRIIDVSQGAARKLGMLEKGLARVRLYRCADAAVSVFSMPLEPLPG
ncbi:septal ring lytic transglycosylase RlpA family protein [Stigmatella aurantiaca]|uniref:Probable endolytic peptidoglycan transglycosylase RlpA n=1 Tax=Stigmatella aurantiaca (strain DW4/3-1) TaxID=378806 RepID=E3FX26_STIAD|nr:septal ring lytic transglycosylase RlpA family protein [Stigmatella aurantiaca]ADO71077.1 lipoprotein, RlpA family [Stigmatella aurantiaca DW4/3-1]